jgi:hypothetical protein
MLVSTSVVAGQFQFWITTNVALICARDLEGSSVRTTDACARMAAVNIADAAVDNHVGTGHE